MKPYNIVKEFEKAVAEYTGAPYAIAVDSCTNALLLCCEYLQVVQVILPSKTYVGVAYSVLNAGGSVVFQDYEWEGWYQLRPYPIIDSARRFYKGMFADAKDEVEVHCGKDCVVFVCLSFHWKKFIPIGRGGIILTNDDKADKILRKMRFDGRAEDTEPKEDIFITPGHHCYMLPEEAARGLLFMSDVKDYYEDLPEPNYPDLSKNFVYTKGSKWWLYKGEKNGSNNT